VFLWIKERALSWRSIIVLYKTLIKPVLTYAPETRVLSTCEEKVLAISERNVLRATYGPEATMDGELGTIMNYMRTRISSI
jgi:glutamine amidotransferase PdxT